MIIQTTLRVDALRHTANFAAAARASLQGHYFTPEDIYRLLVWHTPEFADYAGVMFVLRPLVERLRATHLQVQPVAPSLWLLTVHQPTGADPYSLVAGVLVKLHYEGHVIAAEVLGENPFGIYTLEYAEHQKLAQPTGWLEGLEATWPCTPIPLPAPRLEDTPKKPREQRAQKPRAERMKQVHKPPQAAANPAVAVEQTHKKRTHAQPARPSRRQVKIAREQAQQLQAPVIASTQPLNAGAL